MSLRIGDQTVMASDGRCEGGPSFQGFALSLNVTNESEADRLFAALSDGGRGLSSHPVSEWSLIGSVYHG